jgi:hypothetical protein
VAKCVTHCLDFGTTTTAEATAQKRDRWAKAVAFELTA